MNLLQGCAWHLQAVFDAVAPGKVTVICPELAQIFLAPGRLAAASSSLGSSPVGKAWAIGPPAQHDNIFSH